MAVVTGAGRGLGRAYALLLAARGARVVVNDLGGAIDGSGADEGPAAQVVAEITAVGGQAVADGSDVTTADVVATALAAYGRIDVLINNAGIVRWGGPTDVTDDDLAQHLAVHLQASFATARAAWPHLQAQGYGRIVNTTSAGVFGLPTNLSYAAAKGGVIGLTRSLAAAGRRHGIAVNAIAPAAVTRMGGTPESAEQMDPALAAPMAAFLAHESCPVSGEVYAAGAGRFSRLVLSASPGWVGSAPTPEDVAENWGQINDLAGATVPTDLQDWSRGFLGHLADQRLTPPGARA